MGRAPLPVLRIKQWKERQEPSLPESLILPYTQFSVTANKNMSKITADRGKYTEKVAIRFKATGQVVGKLFSNCHVERPSQLAKNTKESTQIWLFCL